MPGLALDAARTQRPQRLRELFAGRWGKARYELFEMIDFSDGNAGAIILSGDDRGVLAGR